MYEGLIDIELFEVFIEELLLYCGRWLKPKSFLVMDNVLFHHSEKIKQMCNDARVVLLFLPPYLLNFNSIEEFFGELKMYIRQGWDEYEGFIRADFLSFLEECIDVVSA